MQHFLFLEKRGIWFNRGMKLILTILICITCFGTMAQTNNFTFKNGTVSNWDYYYSGLVLSNTIAPSEKVEFFKANSEKICETQSHATNFLFTTNCIGTIQIGENHFNVKTIPLILVTSEVVTQWTTISETSPVLSPSQMTDLVYRPLMLNQAGDIISNTIGIIQWNQKPVKTIFESISIGKISRSIANSEFNKIPQ